MLGVMTNHPAERTQLSSIKFMFAFTAGIVVSATLLPSRRTTVRDAIRSLLDEGADPNDLPEDGTVQVTYNGHPLYFYAHEGKREVKCHDIFLNGGNWYVVQPGGDAAPPG